MTIRPLTEDEMTHLPEWPGGEVVLALDALDAIRLRCTGMRVFVLEQIVLPSGAIAFRVVDERPKSAQQPRDCKP